MSNTIFSQLFVKKTGFSPTSELFSFKVLTKSAILTYTGLLGFTMISEFTKNEIDCLDDNQEDKSLNENKCFFNIYK